MITPTLEWQEIENVVQYLRDHNRDPSILPLLEDIVKLWYTPVKPLTIDVPDGN